MKKLLLMGCLLLFALLQACNNDANNTEQGAYKGKQPVIFIEPNDRQFAVDAANIGLLYI